MQTSSLYVSRKSTGVRHRDDFLNRPRSRCREASIINLCFEDYDGGTSVAVPFDWESEPGTPKVKSREIPTLPPLTPPPSYFYSTSNKTKRTAKNHSSEPKLLDTLFAKRSSSSKSRVQLSPSYSSSSSSASSSRSSSPWTRSYSVPSSPMRKTNLYSQNELSKARFCDHEEDVQEYESSVSTPCFGRGANSRRGGFCSTILKVLLRRDE